MHPQINRYGIGELERYGGEHKDVYRSNIDGLLFFKRKVFRDSRGCFVETANFPSLEPLIGYEYITAQHNISYSQPNVVRGLHFENWDKYIYPLNGAFRCAWVDLRRYSPTFLNVQTTVIYGGSIGVFVPAGVANGFCVIGDVPSYYSYLPNKVYAERDPALDDLSLSPFDYSLGIDWFVEDPIISDRDKNALPLGNVLETLANRDIWQDSVQS